MDGAKTDPGFDPIPSDKIFEYALKHYHMKPGNSGGQGVQGIVGAVDEGDEGRLCQHVQPEGRLARSLTHLFMLYYICSLFNRKVVLTSESFKKIDLNQEVIIFSLVIHRTPHWIITAHLIGSLPHTSLDNYRTPHWIITACVVKLTPQNIQK